MRNDLCAEWRPRSLAPGIASSFARITRMFCRHMCAVSCLPSSIISGHNAQREKNFPHAIPKARQFLFLWPRRGDSEQANEATCKHFQYKASDERFWRQEKSFTKISYANFSYVSFTPGRRRQKGGEGEAKGGEKFPSAPRRAKWKRSSALNARNMKRRRKRVERRRKTF